MMMKKTLAGAFLALSLPLTSVGAAVVLAGPAGAEVVVTDCSTASVQQGIANLQTAVAGLTITGQYREKDRAALQGKLSAALDKISQGKPGDAAQKLTDFRTKLVQLRDAGKISAGDAAALIAQVDPLIACLGGTV